MNRRFLIALAVALPLVIFGAAKWARRWRPVLVGKLGWHYLGVAPVVRANERYVMAGASATWMRFDLQTGARLALTDGSVAPTGAWFVRRGINKGEWQLRLTGPDNATRAFGCNGYPADIPPSSGAPKNWEFDNLSPQRFRVSSARNSVELFNDLHYFRWNLATGQLQRHAAMAWTDSEVALARDGETVINAREGEIRLLSTRTGRVVRHVKVAPFESYESLLRISPFGSYALYDTSGPDGSLIGWNIVNTNNGRVQWQFPQATPGLTPVFSPDETLVAFVVPHDKLWAVHNLQTGALVRTLALVPGAQTGAFSPDGGALYSVSDGNVFRQRAR